MCYLKGKKYSPKSSKSNLLFIKNRKAKNRKMKAKNQKKRKK